MHWPGIVWSLPMCPIAEDRELCLIQVGNYNACDALDTETPYTLF